MAAEAMTAADYSKLSQREHILLRPGMYIGSTSAEAVEEWVYVRADGAVVKRTLPLPEAVKRCFYEVISNASDAVIRSRERRFDPKEIVVEMNATTITVTNYGCPIPVVKHDKEAKWVPEMIFSDFLSSSNYNMDKVRSGIGLNGLGVKLVNVFSSVFKVELEDHLNRLSYTQTFRENLTRIDAPVVVPFKGTSSRVSITYTLDFPYFNITGYTEEDMDLFARFVMDYSLSCAVPTRFNGQVFPVQTALSMAKLYFGEKAAENAIQYKGAATVRGEGAKARKSATKDSKTPVEFVLLDTPFEGQTVAFVNGMMVSHGVHVDALYKEIAEHVLPALNQELNGKQVLKAADVKQHTSLLLVCSLPDPTFKSQVKSHLASPTPSFGLPASLLSPVKKWDLIDRLKNIVEQKENTQLAKTDGKKQRTVVVPGYTTCNWAGGPKSGQTILCLMEGNSAEQYALKGRAHIDGGIDRVGLYRLRGKLLNVMNAKVTDVANNREVQGIKSILGLKEGTDYSQEENFKKLRYGKVRIMTDADNDGRHIAGLIINYFDYFHPTLVERGYLEVLLTPILRVWKGDNRNKAKSKVKFYNNSEFLAWKTKTPDWKKWNIKYYKGLGTSTDPDIEDDYASIRVFSVSKDKDTPARLRMAFNDQLAHERKQWMLKWTPELELPMTPSVSVTTFIDKSLIHYSVISVQRNIPSSLDGMKEGQRKVIAAALKKWPRGSGSEVKVIQLQSYTTENFNYHYGDAALNQTIIAMTQDFPGANNLRYFEQHGQFGTRRKGGADAASPRYVYVRPEKWLYEVFRDEDDPLLTYLVDEGQTQEPEYYLPIFPMYAINGAAGIATGYSSYVPNHNPTDVCAWLEAKLLGKPLPTLKPWYKGFKGKITIQTRKAAPAAAPTDAPAAPVEDADPVSDAQAIGLHEGAEGLGADDAGDDAEVSLVTEGTYTAELHKGIHITELPIGRWTTNYLDWLTKLHQDNKVTKYNECKAKPNEVDIFVAGFSNPSNKALRLRRSFGLTNMVLLDEHKLPQKKASVTEWLETFYAWRLPFYAKRKAYIMKQLNEKIKDAEKKQAFIKAVVSGDLVVVQRPKQVIVDDCKARGLDPAFLALAITHLSQDDITELEQQVVSLKTQWGELEGRDPKALWVEDLHAFLKVYKKMAGEDK